jgi:hypothetical protein
VSTEEAGKVREIVAEGVAREGLQETVLPAEEAAARRLADFVSDAAIDKMIADAQDAAVEVERQTAPVYDGHGRNGLEQQVDHGSQSRSAGARIEFVTLAGCIAQHERRLDD